MGEQIYKCRRCGEPVTGFKGHRICKGCVIDEIYDTIATGGKVTETMRNNARAKGINIKEIRKSVFEDACTVLH